MATQLLSVAQFAQRVSASPWTIRYHVAKGHLKSTRIGKRVLIPDAEIDRIATEGLPHIPVAPKKALGKAQSKPGQQS
jgi:excisionase family DNA binding protein